MMHTNDEGAHSYNYFMVRDNYFEEHFGLFVIEVLDKTEIDFFSEKA